MRLKSHRRRDNAVYKPTGTMRGALLLYRQAGLRGLYFGLPWHLTRDTLGTGVYFAIYDSLRFKSTQYFPDAGTIAPFLCGSASGILSWLLIYVRCTKLSSAY
jgi:solute carrier family 25 carnitine/acylcarnitine transporter 20/29